jgi:hypothetical protein
MTKTCVDGQWNRGTDCATDKVMCANKECYVGGCPKCGNGEETQEETRDCVFGNNCKGTQTRTCTNGAITEWGLCFNPVGVCPKATTTSLAPGQTTTTLGGQTTTTLCIGCGEILPYAPTPWDYLSGGDIFGFLAALGAMIIRLFGG